MKKVFIFIFIGSFYLFAYKKNSYMVEMRDGIKLHTNVYLPSAEGDFPLPVIFVRTPYNANLWDFFVTEISEITDVRRYILVVQDTRGRFLSEGIDSVFLDDGWRDGKWDGYDAIEWIAQQSWCNGKIGMWGGSALGITQYLAAGAVPPHLVCCFPLVASWNMYEDCAFPGGEFRKYDVEGWLAQQKSEYMKDYFFKHPSYDEEWEYLDVGTRKELVKVPMFHVGGWYDFFSSGPPRAFYDLQYYGADGARNNQKLLMGPWTHSVGKNQAGELVYPENANVDFDTLFFPWFDYWLKDSLQNGIEELPEVTYYLMGPVGEEGDWNTWRTADTWPLPSFKMEFYLHEENKLDTIPPQAPEKPDSFLYDPGDPVPTIGGNNLILPRGPYDQTPTLGRSDVVLFASKEIKEPIEITGNVEVYLFASSDRLDTDFTAKLMDEYPDGRNMLLCDGIIKARYWNGFRYEELLEPGKIYEFKINLGPIAYVFTPGHRIKLAISSSNYPKYEINPNTGEPFGKETDTLLALNVIYHNPECPSYLLLPVTNRPIQGVEEAILFPNLKSKIFSKELTVQNPYKKSVKIKVYSMDGRVVVEKVLRDKLTIGEEIQPGIYILVFKDKNKIKKEKLIKLK